MATAEHLEGLDRLAAETEADGRGILEAMCREAGPANWDRPVQALEMYAEARAFMDSEIADLIGQMRSQCDPPYPWDAIASALGTSKQAVWKKYRIAVEGVARVRQRPGPRVQGDFVTFYFGVGKSFLDRGEVTVPTNFNVLLDERLPGRGPSWGAAVTARGVRTGARIRRGHTSGNRYYQLRIPRDLRSVLGLRLGDGLDVRIQLVGHLVVELSAASERTGEGSSAIAPHAVDRQGAASYLPSLRGMTRPG